MGTGDMDGVTANSGRYETAVEYGHYKGYGSYGSYGNYPGSHYGDANDEFG